MINFILGIIFAIIIMAIFICLIIRYETKNNKFIDIILAIIAFFLLIFWLFNNKK